MSDEKDDNKHEEKTAAKENSDEKILRLEAELKDATDKYLRSLADQQNLIKRQEKEKEEFVRYANEEILKEFLLVYDHLKLSLLHADEKVKDTAWAKGVEMTLKQFKELLAINGVEEIKTLGEKFDPNTMEAVEGEGEKVAKEIMPGYKLNGKVIRAARVVLE